MNLPAARGIEPIGDQYVLESRAGDQGGSNIGTRVVFHEFGFNGDDPCRQPCVRLIRGSYATRPSTGEEFHRIEIPRRCAGVWRETVEAAIDYAYANGLVRSEYA